MSSRSFNALSLFISLVAACSTSPAPELAVDSFLDEAAKLPSPDGIKADGLSPLSAEVRDVLKSYVASIAEANTDRRDNDAEVRALLLPAIALLATDFAANRPVNELELTRGVWKGIWDDAESIDPPPPIILDRNNIYQVVEDGFYYNVTHQSFPSESGVTPTQYFLKGLYSITRPSSAANEGELALNVIDLEFGKSVFRPGLLPADVALDELVAEIDAWVVNGVGMGVPPIAVPGPEGQTGYLFNLYVDEGLRIAAGIDDEVGDSLSLFVLRRTELAGPLPAYQP